MRHSDGGAMLLYRYARPSIETVVDLLLLILFNENRAHEDAV
jgi:hypothetical protein